MNAKKILFPTDYSHLSDSALRYATTLAKESGGSLIIAHVEEPPIAYGGGEMYYGIPDPDRAEVRRMLEAVKPADAAVPYVHRLVMGNPADEIVRLAEEENVDLIVMATHGKTHTDAFWSGSVSPRVASKTRRPLLL
ncbi:MAG: universal stress protein, partial [Planctomycetes bacterium]|nr:universal stress protein [Planctomycetota bacterium]